MDRLPFGVRRLDALIGGGPPAGSVVLLSGDAGAGSREFVYTSAVMNGLAVGRETPTAGADGSPDEDDLFELYYGAVAPEAILPGGVHYVSFTASADHLVREIELSMGADVVEAGLAPVTFHDLSADYFAMGPAPREWYAGRTSRIDELNDRHSGGVLRALGDVLDDRAPDNLVVIDSVTDLVSAMGEEIAWSDIVQFLKGLTRAASDWGGLVLLHVNREALAPHQEGQLVDAVDGTMEFAWERGGSTRARTMVVKQFRGVLSRLEDEDIVQFETEINDSGFDVSDVRKIR